MVEGRRSPVRRSLGSAELPPLEPDDHVRGSGPLLIVLSDFECPFCAALHLTLRSLEVTQVFRHFPIRSSHPRALPAACAAEAAALQGRFWEMHDLLFDDQARLEDPHLWARAEQLGLELARFDADRRSDAVAQRVRRDFEAGVRAGVMTTPTVIAGGSRASGRIGREELERLVSSAVPAG